MDICETMYPKHQTAFHRPFNFLKYLKEKYGPVGVIHVDAHSDMSDLMQGERIAHGTPFRRAIEEELLDPKKLIQIGIRGSQYTEDDTVYQRNLVSELAYDL